MLFNISSVITCLICYISFMLKIWSRCNLNDPKCNCINIYKSIKEYNIEIGVLLEIEEFIPNYICLKKIEVWC
jgi:hypothetical protein